MNPQRQLIKHIETASGVQSFGDCARTAYAIILGLDAVDVPHFGDPRTFENGEFQANIDAWLLDRGLSSISVISQGEYPSFQEYLNDVGDSYQGAWIAGVRTKSRGFNHNIVCLGRTIFCDPAVYPTIPDTDDYIPMDDGNFWFSVVLPIDISMWRLK